MLFTGLLLNWNQRVDKRQTGPVVTGTSHPSEGHNRPELKWGDDSGRSAETSSSTAGYITFVA